MILISYIPLPGQSEFVAKVSEIPLQKGDCLLYKRPKELIEGLLSELKTFAKKTEQSDDITLVGIKIL